MSRLPGCRKMFGCKDVGQMNFILKSEIKTEDVLLFWADCPGSLLGFQEKSWVYEQQLGFCHGPLF